MPTNFPTSVDNFTNPTANDSLNLPSHSTQHANANDAIEAVEDYLLNGGQGLTFINKTSFSSVVSVSLPTDTFTTTYDNYRIVFNFTAGSTNYFYGRMRAAGTDDSSGSYGSALGFGIFTTAAWGNDASASETNTSFIRFGFAEADVSQVVDVCSPKLARKTTYSGTGARKNVLTIHAGFFNATTSFDSMTFTALTGTISGDIRVYGYRNS